MQLRSIEYVQHAGTVNEWRIEGCSFGGINLLVGRNASGKTRILNVVRGLANLVSGDVKLRFRSGDYSVLFDDAGRTSEYVLHYEDGRIIAERLEVDNKLLMDRGVNGEGRIYAQKVGDQGTMIDFQTPDNELASVNRRDSVQHPFFDPVYRWGKSMRMYPFGTPLGKDHFVVFVEKGNESALDLKDPHCAVALFRTASDELGAAFADAVTADMSALGYDLDGISLGPPQSIVLPANTPGEPQCLVVKEHDLPGETDQHDMSQGMFRAFALVIHLNYAQLTDLPSCILVDDIGEGLDFERSSALIKLLIRKAEQSRVQLIMTTNDRFVMNGVSLEYWGIVQRLPNGCHIHDEEVNPREVVGVGVQCAGSLPAVQTPALEADRR